jgi:outer membrane lipoprotein-sorting protein
MKQKAGIRQHATILLVVALLFSACGSFSPRISERLSVFKPSAARELISILENHNFALKTFKGTGRITLQQNEKKAVTTRVAWVGAAPDRLRIAIRDISGLPVLSFASDGHWLYLFYHIQGRFYKKRATNSIPTRFFPIPITSDEIVSILAGRIPIDKYSSAILVKDTSVRNLPTHDSSQQRRLSQPGQANDYKDGFVLILKNRWGNIREKIYLDKEKKSVRMVEMFDAAGELAYRAEFIKMRDVKGYRVPSRLLISNDDGSGLQFEIDKYWVDVSVYPSMFVLISPEQQNP